MQKLAKTITYKQEKSHFLCNVVIYNIKKNAPITALVGTNIPNRLYLCTVKVEVSKIKMESQKEYEDKGCPKGIF